MDSLDFVLESSYNPNLESFPDKMDPYIQPETLGLPTWRRLRNTIYIEPKRPIPMVHIHYMLILTLRNTNLYYLKSLF